MYLKKYYTIQPMQEIYLLDHVMAKNSNIFCTILKMEIYFQGHHLLLKTNWSRSNARQKIKMTLKSCKNTSLSKVLHVYVLQTYVFLERDSDIETNQRQTDTPNFKFKVNSIALLNAQHMPKHLPWVVQNIWHVKTNA